MVMFARKAKLFGLKKEKKRPSHLHYVLAWPCIPCRALQSQAVTASAMIFPWCEAAPLPLLHQTGEARPDTCQPHLLPPAHPQQGSLHSGLQQPRVVPWCLSVVVLWLSGCNLA